jgi:hypothetical protein
MASTYEKIATTTLGSAASSVTFSSISQSYTDIILVGSFSNTVNTNLFYRFNSDSGSNYSSTWLSGTGSSAISGRFSNRANIVVDPSAGGMGTSIATVLSNFMNYSNSTTYKTVLTRIGAGDFEVGTNVGLWRSTNAITAIEFYGNQNFSSGSTFTLYGIKSA